MITNEKNDGDSISSLADEIDSYFGTFKHTNLEKFTNQNYKDAVSEIAVKYQRVSAMWSLLVFLCVSVQFPSLFVVFLLGLSIFLIAAISNVPFLMTVCALLLYFLTIVLFLVRVLIPFFAFALFSFVPLFLVSLYRAR